MQHHILKIFITLSVLILLSCERELEIPLPVHQPKMVSNCIVQAGEPFQFFVSRSYGMNENVIENDIYLRDAQVALCRNGEFVETLTYYTDYSGPAVSTTQTPVGYFSTHIAQAGSQYELRVSHPDYPTLTNTGNAPPICASNLELESRRGGRF